MSIDALNHTVFAYVRYSSNGALRLHAGGVVSTQVCPQETQVLSGARYALRNQPLNPINPARELLKPNNTDRFVEVRLALTALTRASQWPFGTVQMALSAASALLDTRNKAAWDKTKPPGSECVRLLRTLEALYRTAARALLLHLHVYRMHTVCPAGAAADVELDKRFFSNQLGVRPAAPSPTGQVHTEYYQTLYCTAVKLHVRRAGAEKNSSFPDNADDAAYVEWLGVERASALSVERTEIVARNRARLAKFEPKKAAIIETNYRMNGSRSLLHEAPNGDEQLSAAERRERNRLSLAGLAIVRGEALEPPPLRAQDTESTCRFVIVVSAVYPFVNRLLPNNESLPNEEVTLRSTCAAARAFALCVSCQLLKLLGHCIWCRSGLIN